MGEVWNTGQGAAGPPDEALCLVPVRREAPGLRPEPRGKLPPAKWGRDVAHQLDGRCQPQGHHWLVWPDGQLPVLPGGNGHQQHQLPQLKEHQSFRAGPQPGGPVSEEQQTLNLSWSRCPGSEKDDFLEEPGLCIKRSFFSKVKFHCVLCPAEGSHWEAGPWLSLQE